MSGVPGFAPSTSAFRFPNSFARGPYLRVLGVPIGNAANGVCGGMVFAVADALAFGRAVPSGASVPAYGSPLFRYLSRRLFDSFGLWRLSFLRYFLWMLRSDAVLLVRSAAVWPAVLAALDGGRAVPLGLVTMRSANPFQLGHNHQVLAYGYASGPDGVTVSVYDPNSPCRDDIVLRIAPGFAAISHNVDIGGRPVRGFFPVRYRPVDPLPAFGGGG